MADQVRESLIRRKEVQALTGLSRSGLYQLIQDGKFPAPIKLTVRAVAWPQSAIDAWIADRIKNGKAV